jgi:2'-5' RNA ligase
VKKRFFFGLELECPWPSLEPKGRVIQSADRHVTLAFLGEQEEEELLFLLKEVPADTLSISPSGIFTKCLFLPTRYHHCVSWEIEWKTENEPIHTFTNNLHSWLVKKLKSMPQKKGEVHFHTTVCRRPFQEKEWKKAFKPLPVIAKALHLFESLGHSKYLSRWQRAFFLPVVEIDHTADIAFLIRGKTLQDIYTNAQIALAMNFPQFIPYFEWEDTIHSLDECIAKLNQIVAKVDSALGSPIKAISYHGELIQKNTTIYEWEMIIDV